MSRLLKILRAAGASLVFWRKAQHALTSDPTPEVSAPPLSELPPNSEIKAERNPARAAASKVQAVAESEAPARLSLFARLKRRWKPSPASEPSEENGDTLPAAAIPRPNLNAEAVPLETQAGAESGRLKRLWQRLGARRKSVASTEAEALEHEESNPALHKRAEDKESRASTRSTEMEPEADANAEEGALDGSLYARIRQALRKKKVWVPVSVLMLALISASISLSLRSPAHKKSAPMAAKAKPAPIASTRASTRAPTPAPTSLASAPTPNAVALSAPQTPEKKADPAFEIVGHVKAETDAGLDESDCVVKDKASVSENLKKCITRFNSAVRKPTLSAKKP